MRQLTDDELARLIAETEDTVFLQAPKRMKSEILEKSRQAPVQAARQLTRASVRMELLFYGLKTAAAVAAAIFLFGVVSNPALQSAVEQNDAWMQETDGARLSDVLSDALERVNRRIWQ